MVIIMNDINKSDIHKGHRQRLDEKSKLMGMEFLEEHEILEEILFTAIPRGNTNEIAHRLLERFGSIYGVLTADVDLLEDVEGVGHRTAIYLHNLYSVCGILERSDFSVSNKNILDSDEKIGEYVKSLFYGKVLENLYMICLNSGKQIIRFDKISEGTFDSANIEIQKIVRKAVSINASYVIIAHNHPGGKLSASYADCITTREIKNSLDAVGIKLLAHIICAGGKWKEI